MHILLISRGIPTKIDPAWGCFEKDHALGLSKLGHKVSVLSIDRRYKVKNRRFGVFHKRIDSVNFYSINCIILPLHIFPKLMNYIAVLLAKILFRIIIRKEGKPTIVYSHYLYNSYIAYFLCKKHRLPLVAIEHWSALNGNPFYDYIKNMGNLVYNNVDCLISVSNSLRKKIIEHFNVDSVIINNMVGSNFSYLSKNTDNNNAKVSFVSVATLLYNKGFDVLIKAFAKVKYNNWHLTIIGDGEEKAELEKLSKILKINDKIRFVGKKSSTDIVKFFQNSDVYVLTSRSETFGVSYIEAMMAGLPVIATDCGGPTEFVNKNNGILVSINNIPETSSALDFMCDNYLNYNRKYISSECSEKFSSAVISRKIEKKLQEAIN